MDIGDLKGRIAVALVEGILHRAGYQVARVGRESRMQYLLDAGPAAFMPDMLAWKRVAGGTSVPALERLLALEVKYRADVEQALARERGAFGPAMTQWRDPYVVYVTDRPGPGRACFQAMGPCDGAAGPAAATVDLAEVSALDIGGRAIEEYERLVEIVFPVLSGTSVSRAAGALAPAARL